MSLLSKNKSKKARRGKLIVLDGTDGSGKTTQFNLLKETMLREGYDVVTTDFPQYGKKSAGPVEEHLNGSYEQMNPQAASILYAVDRFDASFQMRQWLEEGKIILSNRYVTSSAGHQGAKITDPQERVAFFKWLDNLEYTIFGIPKPDLNIILRVPAAMAQQLVDQKDPAMRAYAKGKKRDIYEADLGHLELAEQVFVEISSLFPNTKLVECAPGGKLLPPTEIHTKIWELVRRIALKDW